MAAVVSHKRDRARGGKSGGGSETTGISRPVVVAHRISGAMSDAEKRGPRAQIRVVAALIVLQFGRQPPSRKRPFCKQRFHFHGLMAPAVRGFHQHKPSW